MSVCEREWYVDGNCTSESLSTPSRNGIHKKNELMSQDASHLYVSMMPFPEPDSQGSLYSTHYVKNNEGELADAVCALYTQFVQVNNVIQTGITCYGYV